MHLSHAESKLFFQMLHLVEDYVINVEGVHDDQDEEEDSENDFDTDHGSNRDHFDGLKALEYAARYPDVFDSVLTIFADRLNAKQIDLLRLWKRSFCETPCTIMSYTEDGNALLETDFGIVEVCGITQEIEEIVPNVPCFASTVLMPFGDHIVYGGLINTYTISFGPGITKRLQETLQRVKAGEIDVVRTPDDYIEKLTAYKTKKRGEDFDKLLRDAERAANRAKGIEPMVPEVHRGELADVAEEDRDAIIREHLADESPIPDEAVLALACNRAISHAPRRKLKTALGDLDRIDLEDAAFYVGCGEFAPSKSGLIEQIMNAFEDKVTLRRFLSFSDERHYEFFLKIAQANGRLVIAEDDFEALEKARPFPPFTFLYHDTKEKRFVGFLDKDLLDQMTPDDVITMVHMRRLVEETVHYAEIAVALYGLIPMQEFSEMLLKHLDWEEDDDLIEAILDIVPDFQNVDYYIEFIDDTPYLIHPFVAFETIELSEDLSDAEKKKGLDNLFKYWDVILDSHKRMTRKSIDEYLDAETIYDWVMGLDSAIRLRSWLDAHIPEGESDYYFADNLMEDIYFTTWGPTNPQAVPNLLFDAYAELFESDEGDELISELLALTMRFVNDIPRWENNGYSPNEAIEQETGKKLFYNEDGTIKKVGRNDPCPCGSGKKYKKCCGR